MVRAIRALAALGAVALLAGCLEQSSLDPNSTVKISGKVIASDGHLLTNTKVVLLERVDVADRVADRLLTAATLGMACLADHPPTICRFLTSQTDAGGAYSFTITGDDTRGMLGVANTMEVITRQQARGREAGGPVVAATFSSDHISDAAGSPHVGSRARIR